MFMSTSVTPRKEATTSSARKVGRRTLIATGGIAALAVGIAEAPLAINWGRRQLAEDLANLEGIGLDTAIAAVDATYDAVNIIVMPIATTLTEISADSLGVLVDAVEALKNVPGVDVGAINALAQILTAWKANVALFPKTVNALEQVPRDAGKRYLTALEAKQKTEAQKV
jgi:hypothetical protein